jgi:hypothetical protein
MNTLALEGLLISLAGILMFAMWFRAAHQRDKAKRELKAANGYLAAYREAYCRMVAKLNTVDSIGE